MMLSFISFEIFIYLANVKFSTQQRQTKRHLLGAEKFHERLI